MIFLKLFLTFLEIGTVSFGGGYGSYRYARYGGYGGYGAYGSKEE